MKHLVFLFTAGLAVLASCAKQQELNYQPVPYYLAAPAGFPVFEIPADNPLTAEGVALGRRLFYDPILSADSTLSCAGCHRQLLAFSDSIPLSPGIDGTTGNRNAMPLFNLVWHRNFFWDGGASNLESQVVAPITNPLEMHETLPNVVQKLNRHPDYPVLFRQAFSLPDETAVTIPMVMKALAQFERTLISCNSRYDRSIRGEIALNEQELRGLALFEDPEKGNCAACHTTGGAFSDFEFRNNGLDTAFTDPGRFRITLKEPDMGKFKTPSLRNLSYTAPYMHDGRFKTLEAVLLFYNSETLPSPTLDNQLQHAVKGRLTEQDMTDIIAFIRTLNDETMLNNPNFAKPD